MRHFIKTAAPGGWSSLAREENDDWERYRYQPARWESDFHVEGEVRNTGDWDHADVNEVEAHIAAYQAAHAAS